jgi:ubiquinone/menaquinone biosynthesis C-methylase UbiE
MKETVKQVYAKIAIEGGSADLVVSNSVINLSPNKSEVLNEAYGVLRKSKRT